MTAFLETLELAVLAVALFTAAAALASALVFPRLRGRLARVAPSTRANLLLALAAAPLLAGLLLTAASFLPGELGADGFVDHCDEHPGHVHLCLVHHPPLDQGIVGWGAVALVTLVVGVAAARQGRRLLRSARAVAGLQRLARTSSGTPGMNVIDADVPLSATAGLVRPSVYLSSGFVRSVDAEVMDVVQAHERAHVRRHDPLRQVVATVLSLTHLAGTRTRLLQDLALATEQACDEEAARTLGDRVRVARAVLAVEHLMSNVPVHPDLVAASFGGSHVVDRVDALLADAPEGTLRGMSGWIAALVLALLVVGSMLHHGTETLLNWLTR